MSVMQRMRSRKQRLMHEFELGLARIAERRTQWPIARQHLETALSIKPEDPLTRRRYAQALFQLNDMDQAYQELQQAAALDAESEPAEISMARLYGAQGKHDQAEAWIKRGLAKQPDNFRAIVTYASWLMDRGRTEAAAAEAKRAMQKSPESTEVKTLLGGLALTLGKYETAEQYFRSLSNAEPGNFEYSNQLALSLIEQDDPQKQQQALQLAEVNARQYPNAEPALSTLGWVHLRMGREELARQTLQRAVSAGRVSADTVYFYARAHATEQPPDELRALLQKAIESDGRFTHRKAAQRWIDQLRADSEPQPAARQPPGDSAP
jgi:tetratricopeptide (TPR) repeat protein